MLDAYIASVAEVWRYCPRPVGGEGGSPSGL